MFFSRKSLGAKITAMRRFPRVPHYVIGEMFFSSKRFSADLAPERRIVCVASHVIGQMFLPSVFFAAYRTTMGRFARVPHDVVHKVLLAGEGLFANFASGIKSTHQKGFELKSLNYL